MHTILINTAKKNPLNYSILYDVYAETQKLIIIDSPLSEWKVDGNGLKECAKKIGDQIDLFVELHNEYNLIVFLDLTDIEEYAAIPKADNEEESRKAVGAALQRYYISFFSQSILSDLIDSGREPSQILFLFAGVSMLDDPIPPDEIIVRKKMMEYTGYSESEVDELIRVYEISIKHRGGIKHLFMPYSMGHEKNNKQAGALSRINFTIHILKCVMAETIFSNPDGEKLIPYRNYSTEEVGRILNKKWKIFEDKLKEIDSSSNSYESNVYALARNPGAIDFSQIGSKISDDSNEVRSQLLLKGYETFEEKYPSDETHDSSEPTDSFLEGAKREKQYHDGFIEHVKDHLNDTLSVYAVKSKEGGKPLLDVGTERLPKYCTPDDYSSDNSAQDREGSIEKNMRKGKTIYQKMRRSYIEYFAKRSIGVTNINKQKEWFDSKIRDIDSSLRKKIFVVLWAIGILIACFLIPCIVIQWRMVRQSSLTIATFAISMVGVFIVVFLIAFLSALKIQKARKGETWSAFKGVSNKIAGNNKRKVKEFDEYLAFSIPALRYVYEYTLDIDYYALCCEIAKKKIGHHRSILIARKDEIERILDDLELDRVPDSNDKDYKIDSTVPYDLEWDRENDKSDFNEKDYKIDFTVPYCGKKNLLFYSIIDECLLKDEGGEGL